MNLRSFAFIGDVGPSLHYCAFGPSNKPGKPKLHAKCYCDCEHMTVFEKDHIHKEALNEALSQISGARVAVVVIVLEEPPIFDEHGRRIEACHEAASGSDQ